MSKINIGKMACETCSNDVTVKQNENGTLSYRCDECDAAPYAKTGTLQNEHWRGKLRSLVKTDAHSQPPADLKTDGKPAAPAENDFKPKATSIFGEL